MSNAQEAIDKIIEIKEWYRKLPKSYAVGTVLQDASRMLSTNLFTVRDVLGEIQSEYISTKHLRKARFAEVKFKFAQAGSVAKAESEAESDSDYKALALRESELESTAARLKITIEATDDVLASLRQHISLIKTDSYGS